MKSITIAGGIGRDAQLRTTGNGDKVAGFPLGVSEGFGDKQRTIWFDVSIWGKRAETLAPMLTKGGKVCVSGDLSTREHEGKTYLTVRAAEVTLMSPRQEGQRQEQRQDRREAPRNQRADMDDEIPF
jgi:single-strand DNA-binding protein